jgi:hypothetical protein
MSPENCPLNPLDPGVLSHGSSLITPLISSTVKATNNSYKFCTESTIYANPSIKTISLLWPKPVFVSKI